MAPIDVLIAQNTIVHYREDLFNELQASGVIRFTFIHDPDGPITVGANPIPAARRGALDREIIAPIIKRGRWIWQPDLFRQYRSGGFSAVVLQGDPFNLTNWLVLVNSAIRGSRTRTLIWTHGWSRQDGMARRLVKRVFFGLGDMLLLYSERAAQVGREQGFNPSALWVIGNSLPGIGDQRDELSDLAYPSGLAPLGAREGDPISITSVVRTTRDRELDQLLWALAAIETHGLAVRLDLVGDGEALTDLRDLARGLDLTVAFHGAVFDRATISELYRSADLSVITGPAGLSVAQALFHGVPVVVNDDLERQMPESYVVEEGISGAIYRRGDVDDLAAAIIRVATLRRSGEIDPRTCRSVAISSFSTRAHADRIIKGILAALGEAVGS